MVLWQIQCTPPSEPDVTPPVVTILYPYDGSVISGVVTVSIDASDDGNIKRIWYYLDGVKMGQVEDSYAQFELDVSTMVEDQIHIIYAAAEDLNGNIGHSTQISVIISDSDDIIPPIVQIVNPLDGQVVQDTVLVVAAADDDRIVREVAFFIDGDSAHSDRFYPYEYQWPVIDFADSTEHTVFAKAFDGSGNWAISDLVTVTVFPSLDRTPPSIQLVYPLEGQILFGTVQVKVDASDDKQLDRVEFFVDGNLRLTVKADTTISPFVYNWDTTPYENNSQHSLYAKAFDKAGNQSAFAPVTYTISTTGSDDIIPPSVTLLYPTEGDTLTGMVNVWVDAYDNVAVSRVVFFVDGVQSTTDQVAPWGFTWDTRPLADGGNHTLYIKAYDYAQNFGAAGPYVFIIR